LCLEQVEKEKGRLLSAFFFCQVRKLFRCNGVNRTGIHTRAAINAGVRVDCPFLAHFADGVGRAGFITCAAIDAFVGNYMSQGITSFKG
jgi:hypothetical protein